MIEIIQDEERWQRVRDAHRLVCPHARVTHFVEAHLGRNAIPFHRLFLVPSDSTHGSRVIDDCTRRQWLLQPGSATLLPARTVYRFDFKPGFRLVGFHFRLEEPGGVDVLDGALTIQQTTGHQLDAASARDGVTVRTPGGWLVAEGLLRMHLGRAASISWAEVERVSAVARRWKKTIARLDTAPAGGADVAVLARDIGITRQHFTRRFRNDFGCTPRAWHQRQLARRVVERLLSDDGALDSLATDFGFSDAFALSRFVVKATGMRPSRWRERNGRDDG